MISESEATATGIVLPAQPQHNGGVAMEREMGTHQRGLIDTCLEEGQFDSAIALLDQLRSSIYKPHVSHIRQMIYIALQPIYPNDNPVTSYIDGAPPSPTKSTKQYTPSGTAVLASHRLLMSFAMTNSSGALARALPHYEDPSKYDPPFEDDPGDSVIGKEAICIPQAKNCWTILSQDFVRRQRQTFSSPSKGKKRVQVWDDEVPEYSPNERPAVVGENSWAVLDWLLVLFERDQESVAASERGCYSPLLLEQIPYPRHGGDTRWDTELPLNIVFYCLEQADLRRRRMGSRLMTLLINLSSAGQLDLRMFVASVFGRLSASGSERIPLFFSELSPTVPTHKFKVTLCQKFLTETTNNSSASVRPRAQVRAHPRALRSDSSSDQISRSTSTNNATPLLSNKYPLPNPNEICQLLEMNIDTTSSSVITKSLLLRVKFELLVSYGAIHHGVLNDSEWLNFVRESKLTKTLDLAFSLNNEESGTYRNILESILYV